jgi:outer membrane receptor protein involved in Fe transport
MRKSVLNAIIILSIFFFTDAAVLLANSSIEGYVKDAVSGEPLFGANIIIVGTSMGAATDMDGKYKIPSVPAGTYKIRASYIGYTGPDIDITVKDNARIEQNFELSPVGVEGKTVVVTAQASGQAQAINKQLTSDQIKNIVSAAKIQELPDANAAESVGRLPGVSLLRSGGEGMQVVIRGLEPKYSEIQIDGVKMGSANSWDRSSDLSMISPNMLDGIEVSKTVTADMDAAVFGGTVNFELHEANATDTKVPLISVLAKGGYNGLSDVYNKFNNYKYILSVEDRYFDDKFGIFAQIDIERKNLTSNELGASYDDDRDSRVDYLTTGLSLYYIARDKQRYNGAVVMDYKLPDGKIKFSNFLSSGNTESQSRQEYLNVNGNEHHHYLSGSKEKKVSISNLLNIQQQLPIFLADLKFSHTYSEIEGPGSWTSTFIESSAGFNTFSNMKNINPIIIPPYARNNFSETYLTSFITNTYFAKERSLMGSLDLKTNINFSKLISAEIKFGGKYQYQKRSYVYDLYDNGGGALTYSGSSFVTNMIASQYGLPISSSSIPMTAFLDPNFDYGEFLGGDYKMVFPLNYGLLSSIADFLRTNKDYIEANRARSAYGHDVYQSTANNYSGHEDRSAVYAMTTVKIGEQVTIIPGVRYQNLQTTYNGIRGVQNLESYLSYSHYDTTVTKNHGYLLPDITMRYKPVSWFDIRLSYSNTLAYPDFGVIIPKVDVSTRNSIMYNNYELKPSKSKNYDAYLSIYNNAIGLFTTGIFLKQIDNLIYGITNHISGAELLKYYPSSLLTGNPSGTYEVSTYINNPYVVNNYGIEIDWQTHFWYLPGPLSGLVFSVNYTHIFSKAEYPITRNVGTIRVPKYIDTSYTAPLYGQPDDIINLSLGYDYSDFSIRVSMLYQEAIFRGTNFYPQLRSHTLAYRRWDIAAKQKLPWYNIELFGNVNNLNGAYDISVIQAGGVPTSRQDYGMTADFGIRWNL